MTAIEGLKPELGNGLLKLELGNGFSEFTVTKSKCWNAQLATGRKFRV
jgi:hypothetical protein